MDTRTKPDLPDACGALDRIVERMDGGPVALFLDFDGTLAPIVDRPELAALSVEMRDLVRDLAGLCPVAVVSGRDLPDLKRRVDLDCVFYAGSHGFDIVGPGTRTLAHEEGTELLPHLDAAEAEITERLAGMDGVEIERKRFSLAIHYRNVTDADLPALRRTVDDATSSRPDLRRTEGKKVIDLQPDVDWHKGKAVGWLLEALGVEKAGGVPIYIGDDVTDEDAFETVRDTGIGIVVDLHGRSSAAHYGLADTGAVATFLAALKRVLADRG